jgi:hypothetical protein
MRNASQLLPLESHFGLTSPVSFVTINSSNFCDQFVCPQYSAALCQMKDMLEVPFTQQETSNIRITDCFAVYMSSLGIALKITSERGVGRESISFLL